MNCAIIYFTSKIYRQIFVNEEGQELHQFLVNVVILEHVMKLFKIFLETMIWDTPLDVAEGIKERKQLEANYANKKAGYGDD